MTSGQHIDYDALAIQAMRGVVKACLAQVSRTGLLGDHHFYIAFNTQAPGVGLSKRLKDKYPLEMTIVLQHRFWDLAVDDERFEVKLTFDGIPERLVVPFAAVKVFYDPSVPYVLQFEDVGKGAATETGRRGPRRTGGAAGTRRDLGSNGQANTEPLDRSRHPSRAIEEADVAVPDPRSTTPDDAAARDDGDTPIADTPGHAPSAPKPAARRTSGSPPDGKPATAAAEKGEDSGPAPDEAIAEEAASSPEGGAKIFDLSKFRSKK